MAELKRPSRLALALLAVVLPAMLGWVCREAIDPSESATGVQVELPAGPSALPAAAVATGAPDSADEGA